MTRHGFSLVELSIVLVILGLLTGGILAGQSLIRASELRAISTEYSRWITATQSFRGKYFALPGDMPNAVRFWGAQTGATTDGRDAACAALTTAATGTATCNGDGNGQIADWVTGSTTSEYEMWRYWQHLANAGLVEGSYSGVNDGSAHKSLIGTNVPRSKITNAGWSMIWLGNYAGDTDYFAANYGNFFSFGAATNYFTYGAALRAEEAWNIDTKNDDGLPHTGRVIAFKNNGSRICSAVGNTAYNLTSAANNCALMFLPGL